MTTLRHFSLVRVAYRNLAGHQTLCIRTHSLNRDIFQKTLVVAMQSLSFKAEFPDVMKGEQRRLTRNGVTDVCFVDECHLCR